MLSIVFNTIEIYQIIDMPKKSPEQKAEEERRYIAASGAANTAELELFLTDPNHAIRAKAAMNLDADAENDKFWGVRMEVVHHANVSKAILRRLLEIKVSKRDVVHHAACKKL